MTTTKAQITAINFLGSEITVLLMPDSSFRVALSQAVALGFLTIQENAVRDVKRLLGKDFKLIKVGTEVNRNPVNTLSLLEFEKLVNVEYPK
jgi:hypothetical protein